MKPHRLYCLFVLVTTLLAGPADAQKASGAAKDKTDTTALARSRSLKAITGLTPRQEEDLQKVFSDSQLEFQQLQARVQQLPLAQRQQSLLSFAQQRRLRIMGLLTPDQQQQFSQLIAQRAGSRLPAAPQRSEQYQATLKKLEQPLKGGTFRGMTKTPKS
jgi:hypothetical protein